MSIVKNWGVILVIAAAMTGCGQEHNHKGKTPLVEVSGEFLYKEDLQAALPLNISKDDSVLFAEHYIRNRMRCCLIRRRGIFPIMIKSPNWWKIIAVH